MIRIKSARRAVLITLGTVIFVACVNGTQIKAQTVWVVCTWDTSSVYNQKDGKERFERRFYVTDLIPTTTNVYVALTNHVPGLEQPCAEYLKKTVVKAAEERGEGIESGTLKVLKSIEDAGNNAGNRHRWSYTPKRRIEQKRAEMIKDSKDAGRVVMRFNWDLSRRTEAADLAKERQRGPANLADPPVKQPLVRKPRKPATTTRLPELGGSVTMPWALCSPCEFSASHPDAKLSRRSPAIFRHAQD